jgi:hypothetical protein
VERYDLRVALAEDYGHALVDLYRAGAAVVCEPDAPGWFHAQRVLVALARGRLVQVDPERRELARKQEASTLLRLRDFANGRARSVRATTRQLKRRRRRLEALACGWEDAAELLIHGEVN